MALRMTRCCASVVILALFMATISSLVVILAFENGFNFIAIIAAIWCVVWSLCGVVFVDITRRNPANSHTVISLIQQYLIIRLLILRGQLVSRNFGKLTALADCGQERLLLNTILSKNSSTEFGEKHKFKNIKSREDYRRRVPLSVYADYRSYFEKLADSSSDFLSEKVMTRDPVVYLATSSGTTGKNKTLPLTSFTKRTAMLNVNPVMVSTAASLGGFHMGRVLLISYSAEKVLCKSGLFKGPVSSHIGKSFPFLVVPTRVYAIHNETLVLHLLAVFALAEPEVCQLESLFSTLVYSFWRHIEHFWPLVCKVIETGRLEFPDIKQRKKCSDSNNGFCATNDSTRSNQVECFQTDDESLNRHMTFQLEEYFNKRLKADPKRASFLREKFSTGFDGIALKIWPNLRYVRMINTGGFAPHAYFLGRVHLKDVVQLSLLHAASEGFFGLNLASNSDWHSQVCYVLQPEYGLFEFIHENSIYEDEQQTIFLEEVQVGENYELVYTSQTGLYRYKTGDVIKITGFYNNCPTYEFLYRTGQVLNLFWEKTPEYVLNTAVERCVSNMDGLVLVDFIATEDLYMPESYRRKHVRKHYVLFIEVRKKEQLIVLNHDDMKKFDETLKEIFELYASLRKACSIDAMQVIQVDGDAFDNIRISASTPQRKLPRVIRDPVKIQELLEFSLSPW